MEEPKLDKELHIKYWQRCLKSVLPTGYTSNDSSRMTLAFFILAALDLLGAGVEILPPSDAEAFRSWILSCQHPYGGFCGSPNQKYPDFYYEESGRSDIAPANLPATFFALLSLAIVGKVSDADRAQCLKWLRKLQRSDGSFGEFLSRGGSVEGGRDMRYCYVAVCVRWMLRGELESVRGKPYEDIDVDKLVKHIRAGETYEGGIGETSRHESHAGYTYCAIACLSFLGRLPQFNPKNTANTSQVKKPSGLTNLPGTIRWLLSRQLAYSEPGEKSVVEDQIHMNDERQGTTDPEVISLANLTLNEPLFVGFNGRVNKEADTCYCFWVCGSLETLGRGKLVSRDAARRFLLEQTQHKIGGFGKTPGDPPDLYHSYLGLATLAMMREPGLKELNPVLCVSNQLKDRIDKDMKEHLTPTHGYWRHHYLFLSSEAHPDHAQRLASDEGPPEFMTELSKELENSTAKQTGSTPSLKATIDS